MVSEEKIIYIFLGTTAELIKLLPVLHRLNNLGKKYRIVLSGQTKVDFGEFKNLAGKCKVYHSFAYKSNYTDSSTLNFLSWALKTFFNVTFWSINEFKNQKKKVIFVVQGDTVTALIGALAAKLSGIKVAHIEAGLRSYNIFEPFPEEICRTAISYFADIDFCPNKWACDNLKNKPGIKINTRWNTSVESFKMATSLNDSSRNLKSINHSNYFLLILHRQEHVLFRRSETKKLIENILSYVNKDLKCVFIVHTTTKNFLSSVGLWKLLESNKYVKVVERLPYRQFTGLLRNAKCVVTDGGGNQTESHYLGKPCLILRKTTEQIEGIGANVLVSCENNKIISDFFKNMQKYKFPEKKVSVWPSEIIVKSLLNFQN